MMAVAKDLAAFLMAREGALGLRQRRRKREAHDSFVLAVETIACNLAWSTADPLGRPLAVPRDKNVMGGASRYKHACYGRGFVEVLDLLVHPELGLADDVGRGYRYVNGNAAPSSIQPTTLFLDCFVPDGVTWRDFRREQEPEVLVLKAEKEKGARTGERLDYVDNTLTRHLRREVVRLNRFLEKAPFWFVDEAGATGLDREGQPFDPLRRTLWRGFSRGSWSEGGRLWGGAWENMRRADRYRLLRIGSAACPAGERVCTVDFRSLYPVLAYHLAGVPVPSADLYDVRGNRSYRNGYKSLVGAAFFATRRFSRLPDDVAEHFPPGTRAAEVIEAVEQFHAPIRHLLWQGYGHQLAHAESTILIAALEDLYGQNIVALPLHDAVIVAESEAERARVALETAFTEHFRGRGRASVSIDFGEHHQEFSEKVAELAPC